MVVRACASENNLGSKNHSNGNIPMIASAENVISTINESENQLNESDFMDVPCILDVYQRGLLWYFPYQ